ncbi:hypothetical protein ACHQM5_018584 [Ranunculus cassubicifolius]
MIKFNMKSSLSYTIFSIFLISQFLVSNVSGDLENFGESLNPEILAIKKQKLTKFVVYDHNIVSPPNATAFVIVPAPNATGAGNTAFRSLTLVDNALTIGPELNSTLVGRNQGIFAATDREQVGLFSAFNFLMLTGKYNGSTVSIYGRNQILNPVREFPIIGGSGVFRFAKGYAEARTADFSPATGDAVIQFTLYVLHY